MLKINFFIRGDLGNIVADENGVAEIFFEKEMLKMNKLFGRPIVILKNEDKC